ncbi:XRE family transcriptional regulator [Wolbachia endosymbiont (group E) of Neria commutata]|uniref:XRE family transcriptional regulator n=1 Tax=Wolbachia endosymbiont (group E) of Neria commutata TaxID=3066149 RepID=UPI0031332AF6
MEILDVTKSHTKETLIQMINKSVDDNQWSNKETAHVLQTSLADISLIKRLNTANFSLDRLLIFLVRLDYKVTISISIN